VQRRPAHQDEAAVAHEHELLQGGYVRARRRLVSDDELDGRQGQEEGYNGREAAMHVLAGQQEDQEGQTGGGHDREDGCGWKGKGGEER
jgi:hypothetical protein